MGRWTHSEDSDPLGRHLGRWSNLRTQTFRLCRSCEHESDTPFCGACGAETEEAARTLGDFTFSESAWALKPDGLDVPAPAYLMTRAQEDPRSLGISIVAPLVHEPSASPDDVPLARIGAAGLLRADWVADPAANPTGLSSGPQNSASPGALDLPNQVAQIAQQHGVRACLEALAAFAMKGETQEAPQPEQATQPEIVPPRVPPPPPQTPHPALLNAIRVLQAEVRSLRQGATAEIPASRDLATSLRQATTAMGAPASSRDVEAVESLLAQGASGPARLLASALLQNAKAKSQETYAETTFAPLTPQPIAADQASLTAQADVLRAAGLPLPPSPATPPSPRH